MNTMLKQMKALRDYSLSALLFAHAYCCRFFAFTHSTDKIRFLHFPKDLSLVFVSLLSFFVKFKRLTSAAIGLNKKEKYREFYSRTYH